MSAAAGRSSALGGRLGMALGVAALVIFSKTWLPIVFGGEPPKTVPSSIQLVYLLAYGIGALLAVSRLGEVVGLLARAPFLGLLLALAAASTVWSIAPEETLRSVVALAGTTLAGVALAGRFGWAELSEIFATAFGIILVGSLGAALLAPEVGRMQVEFPGAWRGLYGHKNALGGNMAAAFSVFVAAAVFRPRRALLWGGFAVAAAALIVLSTSKTALVAALLGGAGLLFVALIRRGGAVTVAISYAALLATAAGALAGALGGDVLLEALGKDATLTGRTQIWEAAVRQIADRPWLGFGYSTLWEPNAVEGPTAWIWKETRFEASHAHNAWLEIALGLGLVGVVAWTLLFLRTWMGTVMAVYRHGSAWLAAPFLLTYSLTSLTESVALTYNDLRWVMFTSVAVKLARWGQDPLADAGAVRATSA